MMERMKTYAILAETLIIAVLAVILWGSWHAGKTGTPLPGDKTVSRVTVTSEAPLVGYDKQQLRARGSITEAVAKDTGKAVLSTGQIKDDSGTRNIAAILDVQAGETQLIEKRPFLETMGRFEVGLGYGLESGDLAKAVQLRATLGRIGPVYFTGQAEYFDVDRTENRHPWNAMAFINVRF